MQTDFVQRILVEGLDVRYLVVGDDFRFRQRSQRAISLFLRWRVRQTGFEVVNTRTFHRWRRPGQQYAHPPGAGRGRSGQGAQRLLGRPYRICGRVSPGQQRGRTIGFHTANIHLHRTVSPVKGVFAVRVSGLGDKRFTWCCQCGNAANGGRQLLCTGSTPV